ncbi:MAG: hypothetical protein R2751_09230 [Bacteroidales bacterium]
MLGFVLLGLSGKAAAQINLYVGGGFHGNYSWLRGDEHTFEPGFGGGLSFIYWEYEYWFVKAGIDYMKKSSSMLDYPEEYEVPIESPDDKVQISYTEHLIGIPLTVYFRPLESGNNALLVTGTMEMMAVAKLQEHTEEYGDVVLKGGDAKTWTKTNIGIGAGYQRMLQKHMYLNAYPSFQVDIRGARAYNSILFTVELIFGVY